MKELLELILESLTRQGEKEFEHSCMLIIEKFQELKQTGMAVQLIPFLRREYFGEVDLYDELIEYLSEIIRDEVICNERLHRRLEKEVEQGAGDWLWLFHLKMQLMISDFRLNIGREISETYKINDYISKMYQEKIDATYTRYPISECDQKYVVLVTELLPRGHAPSEIVYELARIMECRLGMKAFLLNIVTSEKYETDIKNILRRYYFKNKLWDGEGGFEVNHKGHVLEGYQFVLDDNVESGRELIKKIYDLKPLCVWNMGGIPILAETMKQFTTYLYMQFTEGYPGVPADYVLNCSRGVTEKKTNEEKFLVEHGINLKDIKIDLQHPFPEGKLQRKDYNIPEDAFCIAVVGNRLEADCTADFVSIIAEILRQDQEIYLLFIGLTKQELQDEISKYVENMDRVRFLGYQKEVCEAIALTDLFVNPPRLGGGTGGNMFLAQGKPIVTLSQGDVAALVDSDFYCSSLEEYPATILKYKNDIDFYEERSRLAKANYERNKTDEDELAEQLQGIFEEIWANGSKEGLSDGERNRREILECKSLE